VRRRGFEGECSSGYGDRLAISTDNSIYQRLPEAVLYPRHVGDLFRIAALATDPRFEKLTFYAARRGQARLNFVKPGPEDIRQRSAVEPDSLKKLAALLAPKR
jgi:hypothetical protein